jgi:hypothetical protein
MVWQSAPLCVLADDDYAAVQIDGRCCQHLLLHELLRQNTSDSNDVPHARKIDRGQGDVREVFIWI